MACFHCEAVAPNLVALPPRTIGYSPLLQQEWLRQELQELAKVHPFMYSPLHSHSVHHAKVDGAQHPVHPVTPPPTSMPVSTSCGASCRAFDNRSVVQPSQLFLYAVAERVMSDSTLTSHCLQCASSRKGLADISTDGFRWPCPPFTMLAVKQVSHAESA